MTPDQISDQFTAENRLYGFAVWQMLYSCMERGCVLNQLGSGSHDPTDPQVVVVEFDHDRGELPPDWFQYKVIVPINADEEFFEQGTILVVNSATRIDYTVYCTETSYKLPLANLMALLPQLKEHSSRILPCLPVYRIDESSVHVNDAEGG